MITRKPAASILTSLLRPSLQAQSYICAPCQRLLHKATRPVPSPTPFVPDVPTFLSLIGRELSKHSSKFQSWNDLFSLSSVQLKELGIEPARSRRYLMRWREKFRRGDYGLGGDFKWVEDGVGELRIVEVPSLKRREGVQESSDSDLVSTSRNPGLTKLILNVPKGSNTYKLDEGQGTEDLKKPVGIKLVDGHTIVGSYVQPMKGTNGSVATLKVTEGLWEDKRGHKVHGGERRRAETLHKLRATQRKEADG